MPTIKIGDKDYEVFFSPKSLYDLEKRLEEPIFDLVNKFGKGASMEMVLSFIWAGVAKHDLTFDQVAEGIDMKDLKDITKTTSEALADSMGMTKEEKTQSKDASEEGSKPPGEDSN